MAIEAKFCSENMGLAMFGSQDWVMSSVLGVDDGLYCNNLQQQPQQITIPLHHHQPGFQSLGINSFQGASSTSSVGDLTTMAFSQSLSALLEKQRQEIEWVLQLQNERLRCALQEEARQQLMFLLRSYESKMTNLLRQKNEHLAIATKKTRELEDWLRKMELENQDWQRKAVENEAMVTDLNNILSQVRERALVPLSSSNEAVQDAESVCDSCNRGNRGEDKKEQEEEQQSKKMGCKACKVRSSCVVFLPCRHLCSCKSCEAFLGFCPVCESVKEGSIEVFLA